VAALPLLDTYGVRATFFLDHIAPLGEEQVEGLRELGSHGHAIGCHGVQHRKAVDYVAEHGIDTYIRDEIAPQLQWMRERGFRPTSFAYPCSQRDTETDAALLRFFGHLRYGIPKPPEIPLVEFDSVYVPLKDVASTGSLPSRGIEGKTPQDEERSCGELPAAFRRVRERGELLVLYAHCIGGVDKRNFIRIPTLEKILAAAVKEGLRFYSMDDLP
jgi:peptidoglycan/xylan/chitin deacetylase (PgdA/CDA1 family)